MELSLKAAFSNAQIGPGGLVCLKVCLEISEGGDSFAYTEKTELLTVRSSKGGGYNLWNEFL